MKFDEFRSFLMKIDEISYLSNLFWKLEAENFMYSNIWFEFYKKLYETSKFWLTVQCILNNSITKSANVRNSLNVILLCVNHGRSSVTVTCKQMKMTGSHCTCRVIFLQTPAIMKQRNCSLKNIGPPWCILW